MRKIYVEDTDFSKLGFIKFKLSLRNDYRVVAFGDYALDQVGVVFWVRN